MTNRLAVIGGGITGLAAAFHAQRAGRAVTLFEPHAVGGVIITKHIDGFTCESGPNVILSKPSIVRLLDALGMNGEVIRPSVYPYRQYVWYRGRPCAVPKSPGVLFQTDLIPFLDKLKIPLRLFQRRHDLSNVEDESIASFIARFVGSQAVQRMVSPALRGIVGGDVESLSARSFFPELFKSIKSGRSVVNYLRGKSGEPKPEVMTLRGGIGSLVGALQARLATTIRRESIQSIAPRGPGAGFDLTIASGKIEHFDEVCIAAPSAPTAGLIEEFAPSVSKSLLTINSVGLVVLHLSVPAAVRLPEKGFGVLFRRDESPELCGVMFNSVIFPHSAPPDRKILTIVGGGIGGEGALKKSDDRLANEATAWLQDRFKIQSAKLLGVTRWPAAIPQYTVGHWTVVDEVEALELKFPGLHLIGSYRGGVGVPDRVAISEGRW